MHGTELLCREKKKRFNLHNHPSTSHFTSRPPVLTGRTHQPRNGKKIHKYLPPTHSRLDYPHYRSPGLSASRCQGIAREGLSCSTHSLPSPSSQLSAPNPIAHQLSSLPHAVDSRNEYDFRYNMVQLRAQLRLGTRPTLRRPVVVGRRLFSSPNSTPPRRLTVLGIETSADDTCVWYAASRTRSFNDTTSPACDH